MQLLFCFFSNPGFYHSFFCNIFFTHPLHTHPAALISVMAADSFTLTLKAEKNFCGDNAQIERSLLPAFHCVKRACIGVRPLSAAWHIAEVDLNQRLLSGVSLCTSLLKLQLYYLRDEFPVIICLPERTPDAGPAKNRDSSDRWDPSCN